MADWPSAEKPVSELFRRPGFESSISELVLSSSTTVQENEVGFECVKVALQTYIALLALLVSGMAIQPLLLYLHLSQTLIKNNQQSKYFNYFK